jgi:hypothetical protein
MFSALLGRLDIADAVITADALHAQREHATFLARRGAHSLLIVKRHQPSGSRIMASLRNLVITILRLAGTTSIAAALRYHARRPSRPLQTIKRC